MPHIQTLKLMRLWKLAGDSESYDSANPLHLFQFCCLSYFCEDHACFLMPLDMLFLQLECFFVSSPLGPLLVILHSFPSYHSLQEVFLSTAALHPSPLAPSSWSHHRTPHCLLSVSSTGLETIRVWDCVHYSIQ